MAKQEGSFEVVVNTATGSIIGRNGFFHICAVKAWSGPTDVKIEGIGKRGNAIRGGLWVSHEAMDKLALEWVARRGLKTA